MCTSRLNSVVGIKDRTNVAQRHNRRRRYGKAVMALSAAAAAAGCFSTSALAASATWAPAPVDAQWARPNWLSDVATPYTPVSGDALSFDVSNTTTLTNDF